MLYIQINAGRNINVTPMPFVEWQRLQAAMVSLIELHATLSDGETVQVHTGKGMWHGETEDSVHISALVDSVDILALKSDIRTNARLFRQDSIALIISQSELIG